jgi:hypothetical protein
MGDSCSGLGEHEATLTLQQKHSVMPEPQS